MEKYELLYILPAQHTEVELKALSEKIRGIVSDHGGEVTEDHYMGRRKLAYPINHVRQGQYYLAIFNADKAIIQKLNSTLRLTSELLRHLIIRRDPSIVGVPKLREEEQIVRKDRDGQPERRPGGQEDRPHSDRPSEPARQQPAEAKTEGVAIEELDKRLDRILKEDIA